MEIGSQAKAFEEMAYHDQLTGLFNRTAYAEYTGSSNFKPEGHIIVMFDLNNLKQCNDSLGHDHGDSYIIESARLIKKPSEASVTATELVVMNSALYYTAYLLTSAATVSKALKGCSQITMPHIRTAFLCI